jgi:ketosteroid isomerase-like protein
MDNNSQPPDEKTTPLESSLWALIAAFNDAFRKDRAAELGAFFAEDARLLWPEMPDILGREAIQQAFNDFIGVFSTLYYETRFDVVDIHPRYAYTLGTFEEVRSERQGNQSTRIFGRFAWFFQQQPDGGWLITRLMTSRFAPDEPLK